MKIWKEHYTQNGTSEADLKKKEKKLIEADYNIGTVHYRDTAGKLQVALFKPRGEELLQVHPDAKIPWNFDLNAHIEAINAAGQM